jgi:hypothetical protein
MRCDTPGIAELAAEVRRATTGPGRAHSLDDRP